MAIVKMKRLRLMGMRSERESLLHLLQKLGCVEVDEPATRAWYAQAGDWGCECGHCRNFLALAKERRLPEELLNQNIRGLRFLRTGLFLGEVKGKRFEPSQALAMALGREEFSEVLDFSPEDERVNRYLKGETLDVEDLPGAAEGKGWRLVCVDGFPLGWGKLAAGSLKNKYYPGWRW